PARSEPAGSPSGTNSSSRLRCAGYGCAASRRSSAEQTRWPRWPGSRSTCAGSSTARSTGATPCSRRRATRRRRSSTSGSAGRRDPVGELARRGIGSRRRLVELGALSADAPPPPGAVVVGDWLVSPARWRELAAELLAAADRHAAAHPLAPGLPKEAARRALG